MRHSRLTRSRESTGQILTIGQLDPDGTYRQSDSSRWLPVKSEEIRRWLLNEDTADEEAWAERLRAWARDVLAGRKT